MFHHPEEAARDLVLACIPTAPRDVPPDAGEHPIVATAAAFRAVLEETAQALIDLIDDLDGDPDYEPSLASDDGSDDDRERDAGDEPEIDDDEEPSIGWSAGEAAFGWRVQHAHMVDLEENVDDERQVEDEGGDDDMGMAI